MIGWVDCGLMGRFSVRLDPLEVKVSRSKQEISCGLLRALSDAEVRRYYGNL
jgi:hypothetical protein